MNVPDDKMAVNVLLPFEKMHYHEMAIQKRLWIETKISFVS